MVEYYKQRHSCIQRWSMIKNNIRKLRRSQDLSQHKLAEILGVKQDMISRWELGKAVPTEENVNDLADYFGVSPAYVLGKSQTRHEEHIPDFDPEAAPEQYTAQNYDECDLLEIFRLLPENGKTYLLTTLRMLEKFYK